MPLYRIQPNQTVHQVPAGTFARERTLQRQDPFHLGRDVCQVGHWGTGEVEVTLKSPEQIDAVLALIEQAYQQTI